MFLRSLRSKIFLLVVAILLTVAAFIMLSSRRDVTNTVAASEQHAVRNVLELVQHDTEARWGALFNDKISTVRNGRRQLLQTGATVASVLDSYARMAASGVIGSDAAKEMAQAWINQLHFDGHRYAFVYDAGGHVLASGAPEMIGQDLGAVLDLKGRPLARALYDESRTSGNGFAIYRWPTADGRRESRYAYFGYFRAWDWVIAISDSVQDITEQVDRRRVEMKVALRETLSRLTLARSGFLFIVGDDGEVVVAPPRADAALLDATDIRLPVPAENAAPGVAADGSGGRTLRALLSEVRATGEPDVVSARMKSGTWHVEALRFQPLGWTLVAAVPERDFAAPAQALLNRQALIFAVTLLLALLCAWPVAARIVRPLELLARYARALPRQDLTAPPAVPAHIALLPQRLHDEVGRLADAFLVMDHRLRENVTRLMNETTRRERFESELNIARDIQLGLLPLPLEKAVLERADLHAVMKPAKEVGGDLYDYFTLPDGRLCFAIGDVSDKGVPAALFMGITRTLIRATAEDENDPARIMARVNNRLAENNPNMMFVTLVIGVLDLDTGDLQWANAGHPPLLVVGTDGALRTLHGRSGPACGVQEDLPYTGLSGVVASGDTLIGYTDGVTEANDPKDALYGDARLMAVVARPGLSAAELAQRVLDDLQAHAAGAEQSDDITLIVIRRP
ncbi:SpoIIE family protein phosphatase [Bordetella sp. N]|uniref:SpoIIE family protein phosphatase n=1 Tax=Bordetella sp. N TaxID=1746199 RepID=UPI00070B02D4|nr:SpoIIE family protein phosphatase [Bordetella sp. N]ALM85835.1 regulator [Bordetella sp. N]